MLLGNILFLTGVWHYSIMRAGLAVTPGPLVVAIVAGPAGKLAGRIGFRPVLLAGAACFAVGLGWYVAQRRRHARLPGALAARHAARRPRHRPHLPGPQRRPRCRRSHAHRFAVGSAVNQTARQIGGALGIAVLVMLLGTPARRGRRGRPASTTSGSTAPSPPRSPA